MTRVASLWVATALFVGPAACQKPTLRPDTPGKWADEVAEMERLEQLMFSCESIREAQKHQKKGLRRKRQAVRARWLQRARVAVQRAEDYRHAAAAMLESDEKLAKKGATLAACDAGGSPPELSYVLPRVVAETSAGQGVGAAVRQSALPAQRLGPR